MTEPTPKPAVPRKSKSVVSRRSFLKIALASFLLILIVSSAGVLHYYNFYSRVIDQALSRGVFSRTARIYAAPYLIRTGQKIAPETVVARLQRAGLEPSGSAGAASETNDGVYTFAGKRITVQPKEGDPLQLDFEKGSLTKIAKANTGAVAYATLPPELVTNLFDQSREKRRVVEYRELPPILVKALVASEDQRFWDHYGIDPVRIMGALVNNIRHSDRLQGGSTITQQLARNFFLTPDRSFKRKFNEIFIAVMLEQRLTKEQILTMYSNEVYLGERGGGVSIHGFAEGAGTFFGKDLTGLTLSEAAMMVGIIPSPNPFSPLKHPNQAKSRRDLVLRAMHETGVITEAEYEKAKKEQVKLAPAQVDATEAAYMQDYIREQLTKDFSPESLAIDNLRVYTTLNPDLQRAAVEAVQHGLKGVEEILTKRDKAKKNPEKRPSAQAALIVLDPHTGEIKAMVGGNDYAKTQLNRITKALRQPGSIFKAITYAAAFETAERTASPVEPTPPDAREPENEPPKEAPERIAAAGPAPNSAPQEPVEEREPLNPLTLLDDTPRKFVYDEGRGTYEPNNYHEEFVGNVTASYALQHSLNVPAVQLAELAGFDRVASLARRAGLNARIKPYPSIALGAFEVTPLEMAGAYTIFANEGRRMEPHGLLKVVDGEGNAVKTYTYQPQQVISPQLAYLMTHLLESVITSGTGAGVRAQGFGLPAAGKTGTSRDGWFAGYTKDLLAIAWVGFDDNRDLNIEGARSALPIWTEFMKKAAVLAPPIYPPDFEPPEGIQIVKVDPESKIPATSECPKTYYEAFIEGTVPVERCPLHRPSFSQNIEHGAAEAGKGIAGAVVGAGKAIGRFFGLGGKDQ